MKLAYTTGFRDLEALAQEMETLQSLNSNSYSAPSIGLLTTAPPPSIATMADDSASSSSSSSSSDEEPGSSSSSSSSTGTTNKRKREEEDDDDDDDRINKRARRSQRLEKKGYKKVEETKEEEEAKEEAPVGTAYGRIKQMLRLANGSMSLPKTRKMAEPWNAIEEEFRKEAYCHKDCELIEKFSIQWRRMEPATDEFRIINDIYFSGNYVRVAAAAVQLMVREYCEKPKVMNAMEPSIRRFFESPSLTALRLLLVNIRSAVVRVHTYKPYVVYDVVSSYSWPTYTTPAEIARVVSEGVASHLN
jgi:hypothetical protein